MLRAHCPLRNTGVAAGLGVGGGFTNHKSSSKVTFSWAVNKTAFESSRLGEPGVRGLLGLLFGRLSVVYKYARSLPHQGVEGMEEEKGEAGKDRFATGRGWLMSVEEVAVTVK